MAGAGDCHFADAVAARLGPTARVDFAGRRARLLLVVVLCTGAADLARAARGRIRDSADLESFAARIRPPAAPLAAVGGHSGDCGQLGIGERRMGRTC